MKDVSCDDCVSFSCFISLDYKQLATNVISNSVLVHFARRSARAVLTSKKPE